MHHWAHGSEKKDRTRNRKHFFYRQNCLHFVPRITKFSLFDKNSSNSLKIIMDLHKSDSEGEFCGFSNEEAQDLSGFADGADEVAMFFNQIPKRMASISSPLFPKKRRKS